MGCSRSQSLEFDDGDSQLSVLAASLDRPNLAKLSRRQLRSRLKQLGNPNPGPDDEETNFETLVDTVLLWNVMTQFWCCESKGRAAALKAVLKPDVTFQVLERAFILVGTPAEEWSGLKKLERKKEMAELLYWSLAKDYLMKVCSGGFASGDFKPMSFPLRTFLTAWRHAVKRIIKRRESKASKESTKRPDESAQAALEDTAATSERCKPFAHDPAARHPQDVQGCVASQLADSLKAESWRPGCAPPAIDRRHGSSKATPSQDKAGRDAKFEDLDADLGAFILAMEMPDIDDDTGPIPRLRS